jgi:hypothetical protein
MEEMIRQVRVASQSGLYYLALLGALGLPDICGAASSENGRASGAKYEDWLRRYVPEQAGEADEIYALRCSLLHQGQTKPHGDFPPIACAPPSTGQLHNLATIVGDESVGWLSIEMFVSEVTTGVERWLSEYGSTNTVARNMEKCARLRMEGLPPHVAGPVVA